MDCNKIDFSEKSNSNNQKIKLNNQKSNYNVIPGADNRWRFSTGLATVIYVES